jgi:phosphatidylinositol kinase/protein kinase (PI-3  family)
MDKLWKAENLNLQLNPYGCIATGNEQGMIEVVMDSETMASIVRNAGGAAAAFKNDPLANWIKSHNPNDEQKAVENFMYSCAGYCVATYVLGIGDRYFFKSIYDLTIQTQR